MSTSTTASIDSTGVYVNFLQTVKLGDTICQKITKIEEDVDQAFLSKMKKEIEKLSICTDADEKLKINDLIRVITENWTESKKRLNLLKDTLKDADVLQEAFPILEEKYTYPYTPTSPIIPAPIYPTWQGTICDTDQMLSTDIKFEKSENHYGYAPVIPDINPIIYSLPEGANTEDYITYLTNPPSYRRIKDDIVSPKPEKRGRGRPSKTIKSSTNSSN